MAKTGVRIKGNSVAKVRGNLRKLAAKYPRETAGALQEAGEDVLTEAIPMTPLDFGALRGSGFVTRPEKTSRGLRVRVGFGGSAAPYALAQHEGPGSPAAPPSWSGLSALRYSEPGTGPKFLERALEKYGEKDFLDRMSSKIRARVKIGRGR